MARIRIAELEWDEDNEAEIAAHGVRPAEVEQILGNRHVVRRNKKRRSGVYKLIGFTDGGRILTVILGETWTPDRYRPITAWDSTRGERKALG